MTTDRLSRVDDTFELLSSRHCRYALYCLREHSSIELGELATKVAAREAGGTGDEMSEEERERLATALHHKHLPKLDGMGIVDYDERSETIRFWGCPDHLKEHLDLAAQLEDST